MLADDYLANASSLCLCVLFASSIVLQFEGLRELEAVKERLTSKVLCPRMHSNAQ